MTEHGDVDLAVLVVGSAMAFLGCDGAAEDAEKAED
jgi:hypothetical protein